MKRKFIVCVLAAAILSLTVMPVLAHDDEEHPASNIEKLVSGVGLLLITLSVASLFIRRGDTEPSVEIDDLKHQSEAPDSDVDS